jgi:uncharacterized protein YggE
MKHLSVLSTVFILFLFSSNLNAQVSGNLNYSSSSRNYRSPSINTQSIVATDSTLTITASVLTTLKPDHYVLTVGLHQEGKTVKEANEEIEKRINTVVKKMSRIGVSKDDYFVDFISQIKNYDYKVSDTEITQFFDSFVLRKNLIVKAKSLETVEKIIGFCAIENIYDIIKVDYISRDVESVNDDLFDEAIKVIKRKKKRYEKHSSKGITGLYRLNNENFSIYYPRDAYKEYNEAFETGSVEEGRYSNSYTVRKVKKETTFYYDGVEFRRGVDKIIDTISPEVGIQYLITVSVVYDLER